MQHAIADDVIEEVEGPAAFADVYAEWLGILRGMWDAIGKPVDERRLQEYARSFQMVPMELLRDSVDRAIRDNGAYQTIPTIGALWIAVKKELENPFDLVQGIDEWKDKRWNKMLATSRANAFKKYG
jgi:hypothetical protein